MPLEDFYTGDDAFDHFALTCAPAWATCTSRQAILREAGSDLDIAMALHYQLGDDAILWLDREVPALDHLTPRVCLLTDAGRRRLKECLMRMPC